MQIIINVMFVVTIIVASFFWIKHARYVTKKQFPKQKTSLKNRMSRRNATRTAIKHAELKLTARLSKRTLSFRKRAFISSAAKK